jgi:hypothetical protein
MPPLSHPNQTLDPDCTNPAALKEALDIKIAAEMYGETIKLLKRYPDNAMIQVTILLRDMEYTYKQVSKKYEPLRTAIGIPGDSSEH